jgi:hypothetical protein
MKEFFLKRKIRIYTKRLSKNQQDAAFFEELAELHLKLSLNEQDQRILSQRRERVISGNFAFR